MFDYTAVRRKNANEAADDLLLANYEVPVFRWNGNDYAKVDTKEFAQELRKQPADKEFTYIYARDNALYVTL